MRVYMSYGRLFLASWFFLGGLALLFGPSPAGEARRMRERERQMLTLEIPPKEQPQWIKQRDEDDSKISAYMRLLGVLIGGLGFAAAMRETAYLSGRYGR
jgi:hypothetical protein